MNARTAEKFVAPTAAESAKNQVWAQIADPTGKPVEPAAAYEAFLIYCELPPPRSMRRMIEEKLVSVTKRTLENYSQKFDWQRRAFAYDNHCNRLAEHARAVARFQSQHKWTERREEVRISEWETAQELRKKAKEFLAMPLIETKIVNQELSKDGKTIIQHVTVAPVRGSLADVSRMLELANKLERNAVDAETDRIIIQTPATQRQTDVMKARASFERAAAIFPNKTEQERAEAIARAFNITVAEILAPEEILGAIIQENISEVGEAIN